jgi:hypothetical protein
MAFLPLHIEPVSTEYDNLFELSERGHETNDGYSPFRWQANASYFFRGANTAKTFPMAMNMYLKECSVEELQLLLNRTHFLSIRMYYGDEEGDTSCVSAHTLSFAGLRDPQYRTLLQHDLQDNVACVIHTGPLWHFMGMNRIMVSHKRIEMGFVGIITTHPPQHSYIMGFQMYGRDQYPNETEARAKENEEADGIFIIRTK